MRDTKWTPMHINLMLHCYAKYADFDYPLSDTRSDYLMALEHEGPIKKEEGLSKLYEHGYLTTSKGKAFVELICQTPVPIEVWVDPRTRVLI